VVRGDLVESVHTGHLIAVDGAGGELLRIGSPADQFYPRSSLKPVQALAMLRAGADLDDEQLALACASHNGTEEHREVVTRILTGAGLSVADLQNTPDLPLHAETARQWQQAGSDPSPLTQNCSGKHAAMLATCVRAGWPTDTYRHPEHPLQQAIWATIEDLSAEQPVHQSIDGCGAPLPSMSLTGLARAFAALGRAEPGTAEHRVAAAMSAHPDLVGGQGREVTMAMQTVPGVVAKDGAEGLYAACLPDGRAVAFKIADGSARPRPVVLAAALGVLGRGPGSGQPAWNWARVEVLGHGRPAGTVHPAFGPEAPAWAGSGSGATSDGDWEG